MCNALLCPVLCWPFLLCSGVPAAVPPGGEGPEKAGAKAGAPKQKARTDRDLQWLNLEQGIAKLRKESLPALILFRASGAGEKEGDAPEAQPFFAEHLADSGIRGQLKYFVCIRIEAADLEKPYPPLPDESSKFDVKKKDGGGKGDPRKKEAEKEKEKEAAPKDGARDPGAPKAKEISARSKLGLLDGKSSALILSFREEIVLRYDVTAPARTKVRSELERVRKVNQVFVAEARRVEKLLKDSLYAFNLGKTRDAVQMVLPIEKTEAQTRMDDVLKRRVSHVIGQYRAEAEKALKAGGDLEKQRKYDAAAMAYKGVVNDYPFPDVVRRANTRIQEILTQLKTGR